MIKLSDNDIFRGGEKIGFFSENDIFDKEGKKIGYYSSNDIYDESGRKQAYVEGNQIRLTEGGTISISENRQVVQGGSASDLERAAIRVLLGD